MIEHVLYMYTSEVKRVLAVYILDIAQHLDTMQHTNTL